MLYKISSQQEEMAVLIIMILISRTLVVNKILPQHVKYYLPIGINVDTNILILNSSAPCIILYVSIIG